MPKKSDSLLVKFASHSVYDQLLMAGVKIALFDEGLLHSKIITVDEKLSFVGSHNMDMRSFYINFEVSLMAYSSEFCAELYARQKNYIERSETLILNDWNEKNLRAKNNRKYFLIT